MSKNSISSQSTWIPEPTRPLVRTIRKKRETIRELVVATGATTTVTGTTTDPDTATNTPKAAREVTRADTIWTGRIFNTSSIWYRLLPQGKQKTSHPSKHLFQKLNRKCQLSVCYFSMVKIVARSETGIVSSIGSFSIVPLAL
jgi:hypothetical protein